MRFKFLYPTVTREEAQRASHAYVISLVAVAGGLPLPIVNLVATVIFYLGNKRAPLFVRWHCTQAMTSQILMFVVNAPAFWWTLYLITNNYEPTISYIVYMAIAVLINIAEFIVTVYTAITVSKREHVRWLVFGDLSDRFLRSKIPYPERN